MLPVGSYGNDQRSSVASDVCEAFLFPYLHIVAVMHPDAYKLKVLGEITF